MTVRRRAALLASSVIVVAGTACSAPQPTSATPPASTSPPKGLPRTAFHSGVSNGQSYLVEDDSSDGATPDGHGRWHARIARLVPENDRTGDPAVIAAFNHASAAATQGLIDQARGEAAGDRQWTDEITPAVAFRPIAISNVLIGVFYAVAGAHPVDYVATIVIDSRTAQPITLKDLFGDENQGLQRLSEQTKRIWPTVYGHGDTTPMPDEPANQPREENFANWIPTAAGMEIHFGDYQFGPGLTVITVPWSALTDVLAPTMTALAQK